ncbi:hypothetical protein [Salinibacter ruber]|uniref:hypothetical protein n=1 Tax=Salinibacter ruber TaxID=146919 RepID=UPI002168EE3F|nr:hypothetical protein [Salinibacter ruber]MCS4149356.1 hypothetical protein [Salinibacter ruber]
MKTAQNHSARQSHGRPSWMYLLGLFFLLVIVDGALRKWVVPSQEAIIFVLKDAVLWGGYLLYALKRDPLKLPRPLYSTWVPLLIGAYVFVAVLQAFNLRQPNVLIGAIGLKAHLAYLPLVVLVPAVITQVTARQVLRCLWGYVLIVCVPITVLGVYQFSQPPTAWINTYVNDMNTIAKAADFPRITGPFPYIGSFTPYLQFNAVLGTSILLSGVRWNRTALLVLGGILLGGTAIVLPMAGSRSPIVIIGSGVLALFFITRSWSQWLQLLTIGVIAIIIVTQSVGDSILLQGWDALAERVQASGEARTRIVNFLAGPLTGLEQGGLLGYGVGTNHQVAPGFVSGGLWDGWVGGDNRVLRVFVELGAIGWLVLTAMKVTLLHIAYQAVRMSRHPVELIVGGTAFCVMLPHVLLPVVYNVVSSALYWGSAGAVLGIWSMQRMTYSWGNAEVESTAIKLDALE